MKKYDVVIVGSGVAGLYCALHLPRNLKILMLCKEKPQECNTYYAQGGISVALNAEDVDFHIQDTLRAGSYLNNPQSVEILSKESLKVIEDLQDFGIKVDRNVSGEILYAQEGGHRKARIVHFDGDGSGKFLHTHLFKQLSCELWHDAGVIDLIFEEQECKGVVVEKDKNLIPILASYVVLASGGVGGLYAYHTNARTLSADLHGIILEHGLRLKDMEMLQFHPTVYTQAPIARKPLISEAVRGEGGMIVDREGRRFLFSYDERGELAPRDIVSRGIFDYCSKNQQEAFLDLSHFSKKTFMERFPNIFQTLQKFGIDVPKDRVPISPAFHYCMGGIEVDLQSRVAKNLYAIGECANNGVHGANRLASNSLLEGLVFGKRVAREIASLDFQMPKVSDFDPSYQSLREESDLLLKENLRKIMWEKVGILRTKKGLQSALIEVKKMRDAKIGRMFDLRLRVAQEIISQALKRESSLGAHCLIDDA